MVFVATKVNSANRKASIAFFASSVDQRPINTKLTFISAKAYFQIARGYLQIAREHLQ